MKVLQFAFSTEASDKFLPHNFTSNFVVYSGTHDNDTSRGWYEKSSTPEERDFFRRYLRTDGSDPAWSLIDAAFRSVAVMAVVPLQDVLNLDTHSRMNLPGTSSGNWTWRSAPSSHRAHRVAAARSRHHLRRDPEIYADKDAEARRAIRAESERVGRTGRIGMTAKSSPVAPASARRPRLAGRGRPAPDPARIAGGPALVFQRQPVQL